MKALQLLLGRSAESLTRLACILALIALFVLCLSILWPKPIPVIFAMSGGHLIGLVAVACYLLAIVIDARKLEGSAVIAREKESTENTSK